MFYILSSADIISNFANGLYPDQARQYIRRDSDPNCLAFRLHFRKGYFNHVSQKKICSDFVKYVPCLYEDAISIFTMGKLWPLLTNNVGCWDLSNRLDPDEMPHMGASPKGQHRLFIIILNRF